MKKIETIWHYLLWSAIEKKEFQHTQAAISEKFGYSLSTVNLSLERPTAIGAVRKEGKFFLVSDVMKLLYFWATQRRLDRDTVYSVRLHMSMDELAGIAPPRAVYGGYRAASIILSEPPADYTTLHLYIPHTDIDEVIRRYPENKKGSSTLVVLNQHPAMVEYGSVTTLAQTFTDIWNMRDWFAADFTQALERRISGLLS